MGNINFKKLRAIREGMGLTQEQMAQRLNMTQGNYNKIENDQKKNASSELLERIAKVLDVSFIEICKMLNEDETMITSQDDRLRMFQMIINDFIFDAYSKQSSKYEHTIPWENLDEVSKEYILDCGIDNQSEYEQLSYPLVAGVSDENAQIAFEEILESMNIYSCFHFGLVTNEALIKMWEIFIAKQKPIFEFDNDDESGMLITTRIDFFQQIEKRSNNVK